MQRLLDGAAARSFEAIEPAIDAEGLRTVDGDLDALAARLATSLRCTPLSQFRATLPSVVTSHRADAVALLDFWLEEMILGEDPLHLVDYLITLLSTEEVEGQVTVVTDPTAVSAGVERAVRGMRSAAAAAEAKRAREAASRLRASSLEVLHEDDLEALVVDMRALKARAADVYFDGDLLRSAVQYNASVKNRFTTLLEIDRAQDAAVMRTLEALRALDTTSARETSSD
jgi:hypothetical protein